MSSPATTTFLNALSWLLGWIYTLSWSLSFYPQAWLNYRRKSTAGTTSAFPTLNVLGFTCLSLQTVSFYYSPLIRAQYRARNNGLENTNQLNDVLFAVHALLLSWTIFSQYWAGAWGFEKRRFKVDKVILGIIVGCFLGVGFAIGMVAMKGKDRGRDASSWAWIDVVYGLGAVKILVTLLKYIPQVWTNYQRQSTVGWSIHQVLIDLVGGVLSIAQLVIDSSLQSDWSGLTGNPVKFGLGQISILFDAIFIVQHYILYRGVVHIDGDEAEWGTSSGESARGLLASDEEDEAAK